MIDFIINWKYITMYISHKSKTEKYFNNTYFEYF